MKKKSFRKGTKVSSKYFKGRKGVVSGTKPFSVKTKVKGRTTQKISSPKHWKKA